MGSASVLMVRQSTMSWKLILHKSQYCPLARPPAGRRWACEISAAAAKFADMTKAEVVSAQTRAHTCPAINHGLREFAVGVVVVAETGTRLLTADAVALRC